MVMDIAILAAARFPIGEPFAGGDGDAHPRARRRAAPTRARRHGVCRRRRRALSGAADAGVDFAASPSARRDVSAGPDASLAEHHSYLDALLRLAHARHQIVHINAVHHLPFACTSLLSNSIVTATLHTPPTPWLESALRLAASTGTIPSMVSVSGPMRRHGRHWRSTASSTTASSSPAGGPGQEVTRPCGGGGWSRRKHRTWRSPPPGGPGSTYAWPAPDTTTPTSTPRSPPSRGRRGVRRPSRARPDSRTRRIFRRRSRDAHVGRAVRVGRRRGAGLWHAGCGVRPRRPCRTARRRDRAFGTPR